MTTTTLSANDILPTAPAASATTGERRGRSAVLWVIQALLAALFLFAGGMKLVVPLDQMAGPIALPGLFLRFIGVAEVLGALGLILPGVFRIRQSLTPLAAAGLILIMTGATVLTALTGSVGGAVVPLLVGLLAGSVAWGRRTSGDDAAIICAA